MFTVTLLCGFKLSGLLGFSATSTIIDPTSTYYAVRMVIIMAFTATNMEAGPTYK